EVHLSSALAAIAASLRGLFHTEQIAIALFDSPGGAQGAYAPSDRVVMLSPSDAERLSRAGGLLLFQPGGPSPDASAEVLLRRLGIAGCPRALIVSLQAREGCVGLLALGHEEAEGQDADGEIELAKTVAGLVATIVENDALHRLAQQATMLEERK